jgi:hypothetical protein
MRAVLLALALLGASDASAYTYQVLEKTGEVRVFQPWSARWRQVKPEQKLRAGSLVVVGEDSALVYERLGAHDKADVLSIRTPLAFRVGADEVRPIKIHPHFLDKIPEGLLSDLDEETGLPLPLKAAWERDLALLKPTAENQAALKKQQKAGPMDEKAGIDVNSASVKILTPKDQTYLVAQGVTQAIDLEWKGHGKAHPPYIVSIWKGEEKPRVVGTTEEQGFRVAFDEYGDYTVAVQGTASDGTLTKPDTIKVSVKPPFGRAPGTLALRSPLPPAGFTAAVAALPYAVEFAWAEARALPPDEIYELTLRDKAGKTVQRELAEQPFFSLVLAAAGDFTWSVRTLKKIGEKPVQTSSPRSFTLVKAGLDAAPFKGRGVLYLEDSACGRRKRSVQGRRSARPARREEGV